MKPTKTFRLSKTTKRMMATITNATDRGDFKRAMIEAQLCAAVVFKKEKAEPTKAA